MKKLFATFTLLLSALPALAASQNAGNWTETEVKKLCYFRFEGKPQRFDDCLNRNSAKPGKPKQAGEIGELDKADARLAEIAASRASAAK